MQIVLLRFGDPMLGRTQTPLHVAEDCGGLWTCSRVAHDLGISTHLVFGSEREEYLRPLVGDIYFGQNVI